MGIGGCGPRPGGRTRESAVEKRETDELENCEGTYLQWSRTQHCENAVLYERHVYRRIKWIRSKCQFGTRRNEETLTYTTLWSEHSNLDGQSPEKKYRFI